MHDPKARLISAAPFRDRVVHQAIHEIIEPTFDALMSGGVYACRKGRGNRNAVLHLLGALNRHGPERFVIKLDIKNYFASIDRDILWEKLKSELSDNSLDCLLLSLLKSPANTSGSLRRGIPIGNLTSQLFANFYLHSADRICEERLNGGTYLRYMDDFVLLGATKRIVMDAAMAVIDHLQTDLNLSLPYPKRVPLGNGPVPFLGFVVSHDGCRVLRRNDRRFIRRQRRLKRLGARPSRLAMGELSYQAWKDLDSGDKHALRRSASE